MLRDADRRFAVSAGRDDVTVRPVCSAYGMSAKLNGHVADVVRKDDFPLDIAVQRHHVPRNGDVLVLERLL